MIKRPVAVIAGILVIATSVAGPAGADTYVQPHSCKVSVKQIVHDFWAGVLGQLGNKRPTDSKPGRPSS